jgi:hypothetical protein
VPKRLTKTQVKRLYLDIIRKSRKLWEQNAVWYEGTSMLMTTPDYMAIEKIIHKYQKKMR